jgi:glycosyltransferase involved in cell wall biosynthesis
MAAGRPAVCTAVGAVPEIMDAPATGYLVPSHDPDGLADRLVDILLDRDLAQRMSRAARARVEDRFSLRSSVAAAERALEEVAATGRHVRRPVRLTVVLDRTHVGGVEVLLLNLFKTFDPCLVVPRLICLREEGPLAGEFRAAGFDVEVLGRSSRYDMSTLPRLIRSYRAAGTDAVLVTHLHPAALALGRIAARLARVPVNLVAPHGMDRVRVGRRVLPKWAVRTLGFSDALVLFSQRQGEYLHREEGVGQWLNATTREVVIPNGIPLPTFPTAADRLRAREKLAVADDEVVVGIVARLGAEKAHEVLFEAIASCARSVGQVRLVVIGEGERKDELSALAEKLGIDGRTTFLGVRRDVPELLPGFDIACLSSMYEGLPITLIEAMAAGLPIVTTNSGSVSDLVGDGKEGFLVPVGDVAAFADRIERLVRDESLRRQLGKSGRVRVENAFTIEHTARGYEELLTDLVARKA